LYRFLAIAVLLDVKDIPQVGPLQWGWIRANQLETDDLPEGPTNVPSGLIGLNVYDLVSRAGEARLGIRPQNINDDLEAIEQRKSRSDPFEAQAIASVNDPARLRRSTHYAGRWPNSGRATVMLRGPFQKKASDGDTGPLAIQKGLAEGQDPGEPERILATVFFADIVSSTELAAQMGDRRWLDVLHSYYEVVRAQLTRFRGTEINVAGDGILASFDSPGRAIRCGQATCGAVRALGINVRVGVHTGECERAGTQINGIAVHIGARICALARPGEVLLSRTVRDLVIGSELDLKERGTHKLRGVPGSWQLYAVITIENDTLSQTSAMGNPY
jgi:class 3 adenylate cyclase